MKIVRIDHVIQLRTAAGERMGENRPDGPHVGGLIREIGIDRGEAYGAIEGEQDGVRIQLGFLFELAVEGWLRGVPFQDALEIVFRGYMKLTRDVETQIRLEYRGIHGTPDGVERTDRRLESYKLTWKSLKKFEEDAAANFWRWFMAESAYMWMLKQVRPDLPVDALRLFVGWVNGDYSYKPGRGPQVAAYDIWITEEEQKTAWRQIEAKARQLERGRRALSASSHTIRSRSTLVSARPSTSRGSRRRS